MTMVEMYQHCMETKWPPKH